MATPTNTSNDITKLAAPVEFKLMKSHGIGYKQARSVTLEARESLGMTKFEEPTEELEMKALELLQKKQSPGKSFETTDTAGTMEASFDSVESDKKDIETVEKILETEEQIERVKEQLKEKGVLVDSSAEKSSMLEKEMDLTEEPTNTNVDDHDPVMPREAKVVQPKKGLFGCCNPVDQVVC